MATSYMERITHVVVDELGIDPLRDGSWDAIKNINQYVEHIVDQTEENNLPLIAAKKYNDYRFWWIIQVYNGIPDSFSVKSGQILKLPLMTAVTSALVGLQLKVTSTKTVNF